MEQLQVVTGCQARAALCAEFASAQTSIEAELHSISDRHIIDSINDAAKHATVTLHVEGDPSRYGHTPDTGQPPVASDESIIDRLRQEFSPNVHIFIEYHPNEMWHGKAAVIDGKTALISTANFTKSGFDSAGEVLVKDCLPSDVAAVSASISGRPGTGEYVVSGPSPVARVRIEHLFEPAADLRVATEDLSDQRIIARLETRKASGCHDRVLLEANGQANVSSYGKRALSELCDAGIDVRTLPTGFMHEKYVDNGDEIYVGSANLTRNGLDEAHEVGVVAPAAAFGNGAQALRADFDYNWLHAVPA